MGSDRGVQEVIYLIKYVLCLLDSTVVASIFKSIRRTGGWRESMTSCSNVEMSERGARGGWGVWKIYFLSPTGLHRDIFVTPPIFQSLLGAGIVSHTSCEQA